MKTAQTWIITCFYLQLLLLHPLVKTQSPCGNPVTDDVNDIAKLVGNLPNDYMIALKYVRKMDTLPNHCWLHLMVPELSKSLSNLLNKFTEFSDMPDVLSNYSIINNLRRIINDLMECLSSTKYRNFRQHHDHLYEEGRFIPEEFFKHFSNTVESYKILAKTPVQSDCVLPSTTETPPNDSRLSVTKSFLSYPFAASHLKNDSSGNHNNEAALGFLGSPGMQGLSIALTSLVTLFIGFILGAVCWKKTARKHILESNPTTQANICQEDNEISMLQQKDKSLLQV
ncbi:kit ligand [Anolis carolinensis]|uniref:Kit ligand n=1 Tax=Anolis carolinensis TaxID=28377 RepID=R4GD07_ANOCA|nr:PREDICTED: kit ligand [Anolis carolinensis]|eukprot:XP_008109097.1 PREDICTED: kit ligand [Anolis carolinensis]